VSECGIQCARCGTDHPRREHELNQCVSLLHAPQLMYILHRYERAAKTDDSFDSPFAQRAVQNHSNRGTYMTCTTY